MSSELLKMAKGFAMVAESLRSMADQADTKEQTEERVEPVQEGIDTQKPAQAKTASKKEESKVAVEDIRAVLAEKSQDGKSRQIKELLGKYGVAKLSAVEEKDYPALLQEAKVL